MLDNLWGEEFSVCDIAKTKKIIKKISEPKEIKTTRIKQIKSKTLSTKDKLTLITEAVNQTLSKYKDHILIIKTRVDFISYIDKAIENKIIAIDTETNNSLDPITCKLMGLCIYTPGLNQAYIPVNHVNYETNLRLDWQLTEADIREQLNRLKNIEIIMHNGKFDYQVLKCTCGVVVPPTWDTLIGAKLLDENERSAGLKQQYISKIDPDQEKYSIDNLFENIEYSNVDPDIFAMYAATDAYMTYKLYIYQKNIITRSELNKVYNLFKTIEMPLVPVLGEMELNGMNVDQNYGILLSKKYHRMLDRIDLKIADAFKEIQPKIDSWKLSSEANQKQIGGKKSKLEQLSDPISLTSPTQLAILIYDILKFKAVSTKKPRGTGEAELISLYAKSKLNLFKLLIDRREVVKLLTTYIDVIPELAKRWPDHRVHTHFNQYGAATGRLSSSDPINFQNIPSRNKEIRLLFYAKLIEKEIDVDEKQLLQIADCTEVMTTAGYINVDKLQSGMKLKFEDNSVYDIQKIIKNDKYYEILLDQHQ